MWYGAFLQSLASIGNISKACVAAQVSRQTVYRHRNSDPDFSAAWDEALEAAADLLEEEARRRAHDGWTEPVYQRGEHVGNVRKYSDTLLIFLLKGARPEKYRERLSIITEDAIDAEIRRLTSALEEAGQAPKAITAEATAGDSTRAGTTT